MSSIKLIKTSDTSYKGTKDLYIESVPPDFQIPEGHILSWRTGITRKSTETKVGCEIPEESTFYFKNAWCVVEKCAETIIWVTVQGYNASEIRTLRELVLKKCEHQQSNWGLVNYLDDQK